MLTKPRGKTGTIQQCEQWKEGKWDKAALYTLTQANSKYLQKNIFTRLFPSGRSPQSLTGQVCVHQCVWELLLEGSVCDFFQTGDWKWGRSHYSLRITQSTPKWGARACQCTWMWQRVRVYVFAFVRALAGSSRWPSFNEPPHHDLFTAPLPNLSLHTHTHKHTHMISSISVIR